MNAITMPSIDELHERFWTYNTRERQAQVPYLRRTALTWADCGPFVWPWLTCDWERLHNPVYQARLTWQVPDWIWDPVPEHMAVGAGLLIPTPTKNIWASTSIEMGRPTRLWWRIAGPVPLQMHGWPAWWQAHEQWMADTLLLKTREGVFSGAVRGRVG
jgi:hypothetical protein